MFGSVGSGGDGTNVGLIVGVTVSISVAILLVIAAATAGALYMTWKRRQETSRVVQALNDGL